MKMRVMLFIAIAVPLAGCDFLGRILDRKVAYTVQQINATTDTVYYGSYFWRVGNSLDVGMGRLHPIAPQDSDQQYITDRSEIYSNPERYRFYIWFASKETYLENERLNRPYPAPSLYDTVLSYSMEELKAMNYRVVYRGKQ